MKIGNADIEIDGFWRNVNKAALPRIAGIYFVYECTFIEHNESVNPIRLLFIGHSDNINKALANHPLFEDWVSLLDEGNELCYGVAEKKANSEEIITLLQNINKII